MQKKNLGNATISAIGMGCMGLSHASGDPIPKQEAVKMIKKAYDMGYTFFDTAECYTGINADGSISYNEELVGEALHSVRDKVYIVTKFGVQHASDKSLILDSRPETIRKSVENSLKKLKTDYIDLYLQHRIDPNVSAKKVALVMKELMKEGKIRGWGISEANEDYIREAHSICQITAIENRYSMMARWHENLFPVLEELGIEFIAFSPMANGFLTGKFDQNSKFEKGLDYRADMPQFTEEGICKGKELIDLLSDLAVKKKASSAQISLAWLLCKKPYIIPIPGSRKISRLQENLKSADITLTKDEMTKIDKALNEMEFLVFGGH